MPTMALQREGAERRMSLEPVARLDLIRHPYGPCPAALESIGHADASSADDLLTELRQYLATRHRVPTDAIRLFANLDSGIRHVVDGLEGPLVGFPPSRSASLMERTWPKRTIAYAARGVGRWGAIVPEIAADMSGRGVALIESPSDPLGTVLSPADLVRLARSCQFVVVDERFAEFASRSLLPVAIEFDNVVVFRSLDIWAGLDRFPASWAVGSPASLRSIPESGQEIEVDALRAAIATFGELAAVEATLRLIRDDRSRLYRLLRKLAYLETFPSWGPFVTARVSLGNRTAIVDGLAARGVRVHAPEQDGLEEFIRFGIGTRSEMDQLHRALRDLGPTIVT
jgi:histidinol-phosphate/aromatic aminotransferase/cobyric acid decarboxylase-like protein